MKDTTKNMLKQMAASTSLSVLNVIRAEFEDLIEDSTPEDFDIGVNACIDVMDRYINSIENIQNKSNDSLGLQKEATA